MRLVTLFRPCRVAIGGAFVGALALFIVACGSSTEPSVSSCDVAFSFSSDVTNTSRLQIVNDMSGGVTVDVSYGRFTPTGADLHSGECVAWGALDGVATVTFQQCKLAASGECTSVSGALASRQVTVPAGQVVTVHVTSAFF